MTHPFRAENANARRVSSVLRAAQRQFHGCAQRGAVRRYRGYEAFPVKKKKYLAAAGAPLAVTGMAITKKQRFIAAFFFLQRSGKAEKSGGKPSE